MQSKVKLSKRAMKEDKFTAFVLTSRERVNDNWQFLVIGAVVLILAIVAVAYYANSRTSAQAEGSQLFARAMGEFRAGNRPVAITSFEEILADYGSHPSAAKATYMLGQANYELRNYPEALRYWERYLDKFKNDPIDRAAALAGIGSAYEEQADFTSAAGKFLEAIEELPDGPLVGYYHTGAMRNFLLAGEIDKAREQLDQIEDKFPNSDVYLRAARYYAEKAYPGQTLP